MLEIAEIRSLMGGGSQPSIRAGAGTAVGPPGLAGEGVLHVAVVSSLISARRCDRVTGCDLSSRLMRLPLPLGRRVA